jgi:hypothetical protein
MPKLSVLLALLLCMTGAQVEAHSSRSDQPVRNPKLEKIAAELSTALEIRKPVQVAIVAENDRVVSVDPFLSGEGYRVEFERAFFEQLTEEEIIAALAHEIGHVWIFSHPPYIHSESLANEIALKVVPRRPLENLYTKLWSYTGTPGNLVEILGTEKSSKR